MTPVGETLAAAEEPAVATGLIDCDIHPMLEDGFHSLKPYLSEAWTRRLFGTAADTSWGGQMHAAQFQLPTNRSYINPVGGARRDTDDDGGMPGSNPHAAAAELFEGYGITRGILMGGDVMGLGSVVDPDAAAAVASAYNDWLADRWLSADDRFRAAIVVPAQEPAAAALEIERMAQHPGFVAVYMPLTNRLMGDRHYYPIYEVANAHGLPVCIHPDAVDASATTAPSLAGGIPTYYTEWHAGLTQIAQANVISLVCNGVFGRYENLKVVGVEMGIAWLLDVMWRLDKDWKGLRDEIPWVKRLPSEYIVDHLRLTTQPFIEPDRKEHLEMVLEAVHAERTLMFSSDYPHWDFDSPTRALTKVPAAMRRRIQGDNARETYGDLS
jgi:predicted TIM-barrel fold metal-dependent hydrolase